MSEPQDIWIVLVEDRHTDVDALPFRRPEQAIKAAKVQVARNAQHPDSIDWDAELTSAALGDGWVFLATYGTEGDCVRVVKRTLR
jgi:hypothetical protein